MSKLGDIKGASTGGGGSEDRFQFNPEMLTRSRGETEVEWTYTTGGDEAAKDALPSEDFAMNYEKIEWTYDEAPQYTATDDLYF